MLSRATRVRRIWWLYALCASTVLLSTRASRAEGCAEARRWAASCSSADTRVGILHCPTSTIVASVRHGESAPLRVEIREGSADGFRRVGKFGLSPVGDFPDWSAVDPRWRAALDHVEACVRQAPPPTAAGRAREAPSGANPEISAETRPEIHPQPSAWRLWLALSLCAWLLGRRTVRVSPRSRTGGALAILGLVLVTHAYHRLRTPADFLHQNGQGPLWVRDALCARGFGYGTGNAEIFHGPMTWLGGDPTAAFFTVQAALGSALPPCLWLMARALGLGWLPALGLAFIAAFDPMLARLATSESYFATVLHLYAPAAAMMAAGARPMDPGERRVDHVLIILGSGLLVAQAARVHPLAWLPGALLPTITMMGAGSLAARIRRGAAFALGVAVVVAASTGVELLDTLFRGVGATWAPRVGFDVHWSPAVWVGALATVIGAALAARHRPRITVALITALAAGIVWSTARHLLGTLPHPSVRAASALVNLPVVFAALCALLAELATAHPRSSAVATLTLAGVAIVTTRTLDVYDPLLARPTDIQEQRAARAWLTRIPDASVVAYLSRAGRRVLALPIYGDCSMHAGAELTLRAGDPLPNLTGFHYYRSSLCATKEGRATCTEIDGSYHLTPVVETSLPAAPSLRDLSYDRDPIPIGLYRLGPRP